MKSNSGFSNSQYNDLLFYVVDIAGTAWMLLTSGLPLYLISLLPDALASSFSVTVVKMSLLPLAEHFSLFITKSYALISLLPLQLYFPSFAFPFRFMSLEPEEWVSILSQIRSDTFRSLAPLRLILHRLVMRIGFPDKHRLLRKHWFPGFLRRGNCAERNRCPLIPLIYLILRNGFL